MPVDLPVAHISCEYALILGALAVGTFCLDALEVFVVVLLVVLVVSLVEPSAYVVVLSEE
jgi:hypothetical protein